MSTLPDIGPPPAKGAMIASTAESAAVTESTTLLESAAAEQHNLSAGKTLSNSNFIFGTLVAICCLLQFGSWLVLVPNLEIYRYIICKSHYANSGDSNIVDTLKVISSAVDTRCDIPEISKKVANFNGMVLATESLCAILVVLPLGKLMDVYGRKIPLYISLTGNLASLLWSLVVLGKAGEWSINTLLLPPVIVGLSGSSPTFRSVMRAIVCDCYSGAARLVAVAWLSAALLISNTISPAVGSWLLSKGLLWPMYGGLTCSSIVALILLFMPETLPSLRQSGPILSQPSQLTNDEDMHAVLEPGKGFSRTLVQAIKTSFGALGMLTRGTNFVVLAFIAFVVMSASMSILVIAQFLHERLKWTMVSAGYFMSIHNATKIFVLLIALPVFTKIMLRRISSRQLELLLLRIGLVGDTLAFLGYGLMSSAAVLPPILFFQSLGSPVGASLISLISNLVGSDELGSLFAAVSVVEGFGEAVGSPIMAAIYSSTLTTYPGTVFLVIGIAYAAAYGFSLLFDLRKLPDPIED
ncbi:putative MFS transporter [Taphrina deformans PYCC 5710]|uniref:MFS transporter n=1 Tax=Taphrina deformans (strain PYCC 5710 / ATCC 11124 / CBS 356.35 / IMI 108563 / JCM 9778 / NBRC 8474) TaxID=1097556 RepID=R4XB85_TAPDE|nr:putative MFS transporter [Taphrina deformans PYCC 5710]|eukprot:CCG83083.1 putative MFS transporter [Taphrina deformans PYCC 5710]